jgi:hypothetical protein
MKKPYALFFLLSVLYSCNGVSVKNNDTNPVPVQIVGKAENITSGQKNRTNFRAMGAGENDYILKAGNQTYSTTIQFLFVSCKPFSDADSHEVDLIVKDIKGTTIFQTPLPLENEGFSQTVLFNINAGETCELKSTTDRFTFWASGYNEGEK